MIDKIKKGRFFRGAIDYNEKKVEEGVATRLCCIGFENDNPNKEQMLHEFLMMEKMCPIRYPCFHVSLNFAPGEDLDDRTLENIAHDYMRMMRYDKTPYVIYKHTDAGHQHVHIVSANITVNTDGKYQGIDTYLDWVRGNAVCAELEQNYNLVVSVDKERKEKQRKQEIESLCNDELVVCEYGQTQTFAYLKQIVDFVLANRMFTDLRGLNQILKEYNVKGYSNVSRAGEAYYKFSFIGSKDKLKGVSGTAKQLKLNLSKEQITELFIENRQKLESIKPFLKDLLKKYIALSKADLNRILQTQAQTDPTLSPWIPLFPSLLPTNFIQNVTVKREYYKAFQRTVTAFRKKKKIYHESTLIKNPDLLSALEAYATEGLDSLLPAQVKILYKYYADYKLKTFEKLQYSEHVRDREWINKAIEYMNQLSLSFRDKEYLLEKLGIVYHEHDIELSNPTDSVKHYVEKGAVNYLHGDQKKKAKYKKLIDSLSKAEIDYLRGCVCGDPSLVTKVNTSRLQPFLILSEGLRKAKKERKSSGNGINLSSILPNEHDLREGKKLHWDDEDNEEDEEEDMPMKRHRPKL